MTDNKSAGNSENSVVHPTTDDIIPEYLQKLFDAVNATAHILLGAMEEETFAASILEGMGILARCLNVDRGYIWQNETRNGILYYAMRFEWQNDTGRQTNPVENKAVYPYTEIPGWADKLFKGECVNGPLHDLSQEEKDRLLIHGMKSVFAIPVYVENTYWGYVSFDDCREERYLDENEIIVLRSVCLMMVNAINHNEQTIRNREIHKHSNNLLNTVNKAATILLQAEVDEFEKALLCCMKMLGEAVNVDRVYIWRNSSVNGRLFSSQLYEWSHNAEPQQNTVYTTDIPYDDIPEWEEKLSNGQCINGLVREMHSGVREHLSAQGILSVLVVPVFLKENFWGFFGFDDCLSERIFSDNEESILRSGSLLIAHALLRNELTQNLRLTAVELESAVKDARAASIAKSNFLSNMSHEMRTPMNAIIGMTQIGKSATDSKRKDYAFEKIEGASNHLLGVINDVLDMSKIEAGKLELSYAEFELIKILHKTISILSFRLGEKQQNFTYYLDPEIPEFLIGDDHRLTQVLTNLLTNAVKFTPKKGSIWLKAVVINKNEALYTIQFEIKDTGIGISREQQSRLFTSFEQAESSTSRKYGGTGLGLVICKRIIEMMDGEISVISELGEGSLFVFTVQLKRSAEKKDDIQNSDGCSADNENTDKKIQSYKGFRILLAEDVEINREIVIALFEPFETDIECAVNGIEAVKMFRASPHRYDMIFMDIQMPEMDGYEATRKIRKYEAEMALIRSSENDESPVVQKTRGIPIIAMTANVFKDDIEKCIESGMNAHVGKPLDMSEVTKLLERYLVKK